MDSAGHRRRLRRGITLVELLVAIAVVIVLASLLMPVLNRVHQAVNEAVCMSNLHQLDQAMLTYAANNGGRYPASAWIGSPRSDDWIYYQPNRNINQSRLVPYLGPYFDPRIYRCPSDDVSTHVNWGDGPYYYSYTVNGYICDNDAVRPNVYLQQIRSQVSKILIIDENAYTIDDGDWYPGNENGSNPWNVLSDRHEAAREDRLNLKDGVGNVAFVDGHVGMLSAAQTADPHYFDPLTP